VSEPTTDREPLEERARELSGDGASSPVDLSSVPYTRLVEEMIRRLGDDPSREGLLKTPERVEKAMKFLTRGYERTARDAIGDALFEEGHHNMVMVKDIEIYSLCEHHILPFFGKAHVAYIPDGQIMGLSKLARVVDVFARRLQVQERLTEQIAQAIWDTIQPQGVGVIVEAYHLCMMMRGVEKQNSKTITSAMRGAFLEDSRTRDEFLRLSMAVHEPLS
jgi:GTP cyclohydrolase I